MRIDNITESAFLGAHFNVSQTAEALTESIQDQSEFSKFLGVSLAQAN